MNTKILSLGFDTEKSYGDLAITPKGDDFRKRQVEFVQKINQVYDLEEVPRTFFILGNYLEFCLRNFDENSLRQIYNKFNPLVEIQQHSYFHSIFRAVKGREDKNIVTPQEFAEDVQKANETLERILGVRPDGLRTPLGYHHDLSDILEILASLQRMRFRYVSSDLRIEESLNASLNEHRQPHNYGNVGYPNIVEVPSHGWQDIVFTKELANKILNTEPDSSNKIFEHYDGLLARVSKIDLPMISVALCLHPWAVMEYDPNLEIHRRIINSARSKGFEIKTYGQVADSFKPKIHRDN